MVLIGPAPCQLPGAAGRRDPQLRAEGVAPTRIIVGHMDENLVSFEPGLAYLDYHRRLAGLGVYLQYDTFGAEWYYNQIREPMDAERASAAATRLTLALQGLGVLRQRQPTAWRIRGSP